MDEDEFDKEWFKNKFADSLYWVKEKKSNRYLMLKTYKIHDHDCDELDQRYREYAFVRQTGILEYHKDFFFQSQNTRIVYHNVLL